LDSNVTAMVVWLSSLWPKPEPELSLVEEMVTRRPAARWNSRVSCSWILKPIRDGVNVCREDGDQ
jgi:hypothetical protein